MSVRLAVTTSLAFAIGCSGAPPPPQSATSAALTPQRPHPFADRGIDPSSVRAPLYLISMAVETDNPANPTSLVYHDQVSGGLFTAADQLRVGIEAVLQKNGVLQPNPQTVTCQVGDWRDSGDLGGLPGHDSQLLWTNPGGVYTTCAYNPDLPDIVGQPIAFANPLELGMDDTLFFYTRLEVLDSGYVWAPASDPNAGVPGALIGLGNAFQVIGTFLSVAGGIGAVSKGIGQFLTLVGQFTQPPQHGPRPSCQIPSSLVPAFGSNDAPSDSSSSLLRIPLNGRQLYDLTARGDGAVFYDMDWRPYAQTSFCQQNRPHTKIQLRIRRVNGTGDPGTPPTAQGALISGNYPDRVDSFSVDCNGNVIHDERGADSSHSLAWTPGDTVPSVALPGGANITTVSRTPGHVDLYGVGQDGNIYTTWRNSHFDNNQWHTWFPITSGGKFPPGAPVAALSRQSEHIDVFAVGTDGAIWTNYWEPNGNWSKEISISPAGSVAAWNGAVGGQLSAVSEVSNTWIYVFASGSDYRLACAVWGNLLGWSYTPDLSTDAVVRPGGAVAAISRNSSHIDIFFIDTFVSTLEVMSLDTNGWSSPTAIVPASLPVVAGAPIAVVGRRVNATGDSLVDNDQLDVFTVGSSNQILHEHWRYGDDNYGWNPARAEMIATTAPAGAPIGAVAMWPGTIQVAARRNDFTMAHAWVVDVEALGNNWQNGDVRDGTGTSMCGGVGGICCGSGQVCVANSACCAPSQACGTVCCGGYNTCGGGGQAGVCGCTPLKTCDAGVCGSIDDGCGGKLDCGGCSGQNEICYENQCISKRCVPRRCPSGFYWNPDDCQCESGRPR